MTKAEMQAKLIIQQVEIDQLQRRIEALEARQQVVLVTVNPGVDASPPRAPTYPNPYPWGPLAPVSPLGAPNWIYDPSTGPTCGYVTAPHTHNEPVNILLKEVITHG